MKIKYINIDEEKNKEREEIIKRQQDIIKEELLKRNINIKNQKLKNREEERKKRNEIKNNIK